MAAPTIQIIGNLGSDPEQRATAGGQSVTSFSVAVNLSKPDGNGGWNEKTDWYRCSLWGKRGDNVVEKFHKGNKIFVAGTFETREFDDRNGQHRTSLEVRVDNYQDLTQRPRRDEGSYDETPANVSPIRAPSGNADIDDLPF